ncbi:MAG TPA: hypothetical protein PLE19_05645 [Planctomycetota bacterium]|nr:hypothetical protein [Planctomycetota bacterium]HRR82282.1 hypothetical protein [Planctomycetota bacterium]HRT93189.1 hypothetical protein [Planctomycetota bacterium]
MGDGRRIVNVINFIRAVEPREPAPDLLEPVVNQVRLVREHGLPATFLIQYDAMREERFVKVLKEGLDERHEVGAWLEIVQPLVEAAGLEWRGRFPWDWHAEVDFAFGYTPTERERLIDVFLRDFKATFGRLPRSVGSWFIDAHSLGYLADRYGVVASCNCKDQVGTDGYTAWGGYWNQAYYPSRRNAFMPAQTAAEQIPIPVFRMLGSDPIEQYDCNLGSECQSVVSLEPAYKEGGGSPSWVRWFFDVNFRAPCLALAYAQVGQENSFGWPRMRDGLTDQLALCAEMMRGGELRVETLEESACWFRSQFEATPATAVVALRDWRGLGRKSVWYNSRFYRTNLFWQGGEFRVRDIHLFDERYAERYLTEPVTTHWWAYDTLPVLDGFNWSTAEALAGMRPVHAHTGRPLHGGEPSVTEADSASLLVRWPLDGGGALEILCEDAMLSFRARGVSVPWALEVSWSPAKTPPIVGVAPDAVAYRHNGFGYEARARAGGFRRVTGEPAILAEATGGILVLDMGHTRVSS